MTETPYDSTADTLKHIRRVQELLGMFAKEMIDRGIAHDDSKLGPEEKPYLDAVGEKLKVLAYGSDEYRATLKELEPFVEHHNASNSHHPEHYDAGVAGMDLFDLVEMFFDWKAAGERNPGGNISNSINIGAERHKIDPQLVSIFRNTAARLGWA